MFWEIDGWVKGQHEDVGPDGRAIRMCSWVFNYLKSGFSVSRDSERGTPKLGGRRSSEQGTSSGHSSHSSDS